MLLKIGELAKRCGLTVRTLHHYDDIGLLKPSVRSESGYRLYARDDIARLHQIQALQRLGLSLSEIDTVLANPISQLPQIIVQQLRQLSQQIERATLLRERLSQLQQQLSRGEEPELGDWLKTLELMNMYDKYFTPEELKRLPPTFANGHKNPEWSALAEQVRLLIANSTSTDSPQAREIARQWFALAEQSTGGDPVLLAKLTEMHDREPAIRQQSGVTPELVRYVQQASIHDKLDIYEKYLSPDEFAFVKANYGKRIDEWPKLIAAAYSAMRQGLPTDSAEVRQLALHWLDLAHSYWGDSLETQRKIRQAHEREPDLLKGSLISPQLLDYMRQAFAHLHG